MAETLANDAHTTLAAPVAASTPGTTGFQINVASSTPAGFPSSGPFRIIVDLEYMDVTGGFTTTTWTVTRGVEGTGAAAHTNGATVRQIVTLAGLTSFIQGLIPAIPGTLGYTQITANQSIGAPTTIMSVTVTVAAGRRVRLSSFCPLYTGGAADTYSLNLQEGATVLQGLAITNPGAGGFPGADPTVILQPSAGSHTYSLHSDHTAGSTAGGFSAAANAPAWLMAEDVGV